MSVHLHNGCLISFNYPSDSWGDALLALKAFWTLAELYSYANAMIHPFIQGKTGE